jgi:hypothetical protein
MNNINIGIANLVVSNKIVKNNLNENKDVIADIFNILNESDLLQLEFNVFENIENKYISEDIKAIRYIDNNIKLFETFTVQELNEVHNKLKKFVKKDDIKNVDKYRLNLYEAIGNLIQESLKVSSDVDVNLIHESLDFVINHVKKEKNNANVIEEQYVDEVIEIAINKFNEKYSDLNESDNEFLKRVIHCEDKKELFKEMINENIAMLKNASDDKISDKIAITINKLSEMKYSEKTFNDDIVRLYELKTDIL